ncbi:MAG: hypothetical protein OHK93_005339 [Ramalina farinacea]|uniref:Lysine-specific metallo-endopeptidase domain-containing protein n=1 Tax=Ramalina farinacea TaxID=258253 RepID=A0AA43QXS4_9LECA|nr:hypothetical protein [Ramalina farinacea]
MVTIIPNTVIPAITVPTKDPAQDPFLIFFTNDNHRNTVQNVFRDMASGATKTQSGSTIKPPSFVCINDQSGPYIKEAVAFCKGRTDGVAFSFNGDVWLCPKFFTDEKPFPDQNTNCPTVNVTKNSAIFSDHRNITESQFAIIIHELAHIYAPHPVFGLDELYDINFVCYSQPDFQLNNPNNYGFYAIL